MRGLAPENYQNSTHHWRDKFSAWCHSIYTGRSCRFSFLAGLTDQMVYQRNVGGFHTKLTLDIAHGLKYMGCNAKYFGSTYCLHLQDLIANQVGNQQQEAASRIHLV
jgi:hypothetical protein